MSATDPIEALDGVLAWLDDAEVYYRTRLKGVQQDREAVLRTRQLHLQWRAESAEGDGGVESHSHVSAKDLVHHGSLKSAYTEIACRSGGLLRYHAAAKLLMAAGVSTSKNVRNVADDLRKRLGADADWEHHSPGTFKYLAYAEGGTGRAGGPPVQAPYRLARRTSVRARISAAGTVPVDRLAPRTQPGARGLPERSCDPLVAATAPVGGHHELSRL